VLPEGLFLFAAFFGEVPERRPSIEKREAGFRVLRHLANSSSLAFRIRRAASVSLIRCAWCWSMAAVTPGFKYRFQRGSDVSFS
jgi:hypothetical protein